ncbi:uncharacterized protein LOC132738860 [Ruditapes philippinarum]|uniref:uncharacterized protein LOC132738860 n=1 Tax=Ruditapes philippinarum TaxID=129788 RepID=UPI00295B4E52|nr:uncharacterized protein LOC132738860 [Ruditapes philippinarum]
MEEIKLVTFGSEDLKTVHTHSTTLQLKLKNLEHMRISANIVPVISGTIQRRQINVLGKDGIKDIIHSVDLANSIPEENECSSVELLIGNDFYRDIVLPQRIDIQSGLYLLASKLGWLLTGRTDENSDETGSETNLLILTHGDCQTTTKIFQSTDSSLPLKPKLLDLWKTEAIGVVENKETSEDKEVMEGFKFTLKFENGRYHVTWPCKEERKELLSVNKELSFGRLKSYVKRLRNKPELFEKYYSVIQEQLSKGIIEEVNNTKGDMIHYIPHHAVINPQKLTKTASMILRELLTNSDKVNASIAKQYRNEMKDTSVLGHTWNSKSDTLSIRQSKIQSVNNLIKRFALKLIASVFGPLGMLSPVLLKDSTKFSSVDKLIRTTTLAVRFIKEIKKQKCENQSLTSQELETSEIMLILYLQRTKFSETICGIYNQITTTQQRQLGLFIDPKGILRSKGRLENAGITEGAKQPILLPRNEWFTYLIIEKVHKQNCHCGVSQTLSKIRYKFWIPKGRSVVKSVLGRCSTCRYFEGGPYKMPAFAPLPPSRVQEALPFSRVGLDYFGPLSIKTKDGPKKVWVCLFTCLLIRAIHLELVQDMSTEEFLLGFKRFISQRGTPAEIISDNAS